MLTTAVFWLLRTLNASQSSFIITSSLPSVHCVPTLLAQYVPSILLSRVTMIVLGWFAMIQMLKVSLECPIRSQPRFGSPSVVHPSPARDLTISKAPLHLASSQRMLEALSFAFRRVIRLPLSFQKSNFVYRMEQSVSETELKAKPSSMIVWTIDIFYKILRILFIARPKVPPSLSVATTGSKAECRTRSARIR
jgi:hypothetical protein